jgi:hypothetical protein
VAQAALQTRARHSTWALDALLLGSILLLALGTRLVNLGLYSGLFDEGIRAEQLFLMSLGYRPFREIFAAQGPLLLDSFYPLYAVFDAVLDPSLVAVRLVAVSYSLLGLSGLYWLGGQLAGRAAAVSATLVLALSPLYLEGSRLALAEVPSLAPAILALGCAVRYQTVGRARWLLVAGVLLTLSLLMKPITIAAVPAVALAAVLRGRAGARDLVIVGLLMLVVSALVITLLGFHDVRDQILAYRQASREAEGWSIRKNLQALQRGLGFEPAALLPLAGLGALALSLADWRRALPAVVWGVGGLLLLLAYSPLHGKHIVVLVPSAALLAGAGCICVWRSLSGLAPANRQFPALAPLALAGGWYIATLVPLLGQTGQILRVGADTDVDPAFEQYADAVAAIEALTGPDDFIVTDQPYLAFLAGRKVPPELVDTAISRIRSRSLTGAKAQAEAEAYQPRLVLLWGDRLRSLPTFRTWVETNYQVVKIYNRRGDTDRALYLRRDADFVQVRAALGTATVGGVSAGFGGELRLVGARLDREELTGRGATLTMLWELIKPTTTDYHVLVDLVSSTGASVDDQQESLGGGSAGTSAWPTGRWLVQSSFVLAEDLAPDDYTVTVSLYNSRTRSTIPIDGRAGSNALEIGRLRVR